MNRKILGVVATIALSSLLVTGCSTDPDPDLSDPPVQEALEDPQDSTNDADTAPEASEDPDEQAEVKSSPEATVEEEPAPEEPVKMALGEVCAAFTALGQDGVAAIVGDTFTDIADTSDSEVDAAERAYEAAWQCGHFYGDKMGQMFPSRVYVVEQEYLDSAGASLDGVNDMSQDSMLVAAEAVELGDEAYATTYLVNASPMAVKASYSVFIRQGNMRYTIVISENQPGDQVLEAPPEAAERQAAVLQLAEKLGPWEPTED